MSRPAGAIVDLEALRRNYRLARERHGNKALAVVKADAYGHGAARCAIALASLADGFAVAFLEEALALRAAGIRQPILLLEGLFEAAELREVERHGLWMVAHHPAQVEMIERDGKADARYHVWLKIDSGMRRAGFAPGQAGQAHRRLTASGKVGTITLMSHFARADEPSQPATADQLACFEAAVAGLPGARSLANSAAILAWPDARGEWARPGIALYGADPIPGEPNGLAPVMTLHSRIIGLRELAAGEALGYGGRFVAARPTRVGIVALGYADGYPRSALDGTPVAVDERRTRLIGRVSMDMLTVDLTDLPGSGLGSRVELWGSRIPVNRVAEAAGTIAYELLCKVRRVPFAYLDGEARP